MKKYILITFFVVCFSAQAQVGYWTAYQFDVNPGSEELVLKLFDEYFSKYGVSEGVTVTLFENHFKDPDWNFSHQILFNGSLDAMSNQYSSPPNDAWSLFLEKMGNHIKGHNAFMGEIDAAYASGDPDEFPIQRILALQVNEYDKWLEAYEKYNSKYNKPDRLTFAGNFTAGHHHISGGNAWVVQGFRDFKGAIGGHSKLPSKYSQKEHEKAWDNFLETSGGGKIVRSFLRIMLATY